MFLILDTDPCLGLTLHEPYILKTIYFKALSAWFNRKITWITKTASHILRIDLPTHRLAHYVHISPYSGLILVAGLLSNVKYFSSNMEYLSNKK